VIAIATSVSHASVAVTPGSVVSVGEVRTIVLPLVGHVIEGAVASSTTTSVVQCRALDAGPIAENVTCVVPTGNAAGASLVGVETVPPSHGRFVVGAGTVTAVVG
jgi:hypothetical protein